MESSSQWTEWMNQILAIGPVIKANLPMIVLGIFVFVQWVALQGLLIHYHLFRKSLKRPRPDGIRFGVIERALSFHGEQFDRVYDRLAELKKEIQDLAREAAEQSSVRSNAANESRTSLEASYVSLGEMNLKKRLDSIRANR